MILRNFYLFILILACCPLYKINAQISEFEGPIKIGHDTTPNPDSGVIRWNTNNNDFEGFDGQDWKSLTKPNNQYTAFVSNEQELIGAINSNKCHIVLVDDMTINSRISLNNPVVIESCGVAKTLTGAEIFQLWGNNITIRNINFIGDGTLNALTLQSGLENTTLEKLNFDNFTRAIFKSSVMTAPALRNIKISDCIIKNSTVTGNAGTLYLNGNVHDIYIDNVVIDGCSGEGIEIVNGCSGQINNVRISNTAAIGLELWNTTASINPTGSFEVSNISVQDCGKWGVSFHRARVVATNITTKNTYFCGVEIVGQNPYDYYPVQISNLIISEVRHPNWAIGISIDQHAGANISNFHVSNEGVTNPGWTFGIQIRLSEHFTVHDGQFVNWDRGVMIQNGAQVAQNGSIMDNRFLNCSTPIWYDGSSNVDIDHNNVSW